MRSTRKVDAFAGEAGRSARAAWRLAGQHACAPEPWLLVGERKGVTCQHVALAPSVENDALTSRRHLKCVVEADAAAPASSRRRRNSVAWRRRSRPPGVLLSARAASPLYLGRRPPARRCPPIRRL